LHIGKSHLPSVLQNHFVTLRLESLDVLPQLRSDLLGFLILPCLRRCHILRCLQQQVNPIV
jgi:hypothetical protein